MSLTPTQIFEEKIKGRLLSFPEKNINATYQFNVTGEQGGNWTVALRDEQNSVQKGSCEAPNCEITIADADLVKLVEGTLNPQMAFMTGKLKVRGDIGLALRLGTILKS